MRKELCILTIFALLLSGCAFVHKVKPTVHSFVEAKFIALPKLDIKDKTYTIDSAMDNINSDDIQFKEFAGYVRTALNKLGYKHVDKDAVLLVRLAYGITPITKTTSRTYCETEGFSYTDLFGLRIYTPPTMRTVHTDKTTYKTFLFLEVYESKNLKAQLWKTVVTSTGNNPNLRDVFPYMLGAVNSSLGKDYKDKLTGPIYVGSPMALSLIRARPYYDYTSVVLKTFQRFGVIVEKLDKKDRVEFINYNSPKAGIRVLWVYKNSVAEKMGIEEYDIISAVNNTIVYNPEIFGKMIQKTKPGGKIRVTFFNWDKFTTIEGIGYLE